MKKHLFITFLIGLFLTPISLKAQEAEMLTCYFYMNHENKLSVKYELVNLNENDTITFIEFRVKFFSSMSSPKRNQYHIVPLYSALSGGHIVTNEGIHYAWCELGYGDKVYVDNIIYQHYSWRTKMDDVIGARITSVEVTYKSGRVIKLDGYPKNSRIRKGDEHDDFLL